MSHTLTITRREFTSLFCSPIAYVVMALFAMGCAMIFLLNFGPGREASMRGSFDGVVWLMIFLVPAISMRLFSEEFRAGTIELLMTSPVNDAQVVIGKWLGAMGFLVTLMIPLAVLIGVLEMYGNPEYGPIVTGMLGLLLVGGLYLAIGVFASALSQNQIICFLITVFIICLLSVALFFLPQAGWMPRDLRPALLYLNINNQFQDFSKGLIDLTNFVYFVSGIVMFLFLATKVVESRRWR